MEEPPLPIAFRMSRKWKYVYSWAIWYSTFALGVCNGFLGPALVEFSHRFNTDVSNLSSVLTAAMAVYLAASFLCGVLFNYFNRQLVSSALLFMMGLGTGILPFVPTIPFFYAVAIIVNFAMGGYGTAQVVWIIEMWEQDAASYIQTQHFAFALGSFVCPLMMKPFLSGESTDDTQHLTTTTLSPNEKTAPYFYVPFLIGGVIGIFGGLLLGALYFIQKYRKPPTIILESETEINTNSSSKRIILLISLSSVFLGAYVALEQCSIIYTPTFAQYIDLKLNQQESALLVSGLTGAFTFGRFIGIFIVLKVQPEFLLICNIILLVIGNSLILIFADSSIYILWTGVIILGLGFSTTNPSYFGYIEKHLIVTNVVGAIMLVVGSLPAIVYTILIGKFIKDNPLILTYTNYCSLVLCIISFFIIYWITTIRNRNKN